ncbi:DNA/RNA-binding protein Alba 1, putative [Plasmodium gallinaceum]|uniref:DNA/RNA-binding protein Alba 1, putative n=1 Tax=Plasmodium gallinaceum TaxID=5849 RepID=A0A1J1GYJ3_PLAGA|nr:DNA/RNA-binding protein Alba 1, putative [Plasmodium gallinaceum]CRG97642.1 DNA/RNA-binding protein Alba 1, putative [Plasmodium gallinaceum]
MKKDREPIDEDEMRITSTGRMTNYVNYAAKLLGEEEKKSIKIKATGNAIAKAVTLTEIVKRRFKGLHQITKCGSTIITDQYVSGQDNNEHVVQEKTVSFIEILLSRDQLDTKDAGYQPPLDEKYVKEMTPEEIVNSRGFRGRGFRPRYYRGFRGGRGSGFLRRGGYRGFSERMYEGRNSFRGGRGGGYGGSFGRGGYRSGGGGMGGGRGGYRGGYRGGREGGYRGGNRGGGYRSGRGGYRGGRALS